MSFYLLYLCCDDIWSKTKNGTLFFTDPPYGLNQQDQDPDKELTYNGVYKLTPNGSLTLITNKLERPNGIGLSLDEKTLYVANSYAVNPIILAVNLTSVPYQSRVFFDGSELLKDRDGLFDGLKVHSSGMSPLRGNICPDKVL